MKAYDVEIAKIKDTILKNYKPKHIILFGSCAKGVIHNGSDIDICLVMDTDNKRKLVQDILLQVQSDIDIDIEIILYTEQEWEKNKEDLSTFAGIINKTGVSLNGGFDKI